MDREVLTPGKLYARLSAEYRRVRPPHCGNCRMPMVMLTHRPYPDGPNWTVEAHNQLCDKCGPLITVVVRRAQDQYDLRDPTALPFLPSLAANDQQYGAHRH